MYKIITKKVADIALTNGKGCGGTRRRANRGQILPVMLFGFFVTLVALLAVFNASRVTIEKTQMVNAADAAAYSGAIQAARALNFYAYSNRAMVANTIAAGYVVSYVSYLRYIGDFVNEVSSPKQFLAKVMMNFAESAGDSTLNTIDTVLGHPEDANDRLNQGNGEGNRANARPRPEESGFQAITNQLRDATKGDGKKGGGDALKIAATTLGFMTVGPTDLLNWFYAATQVATHAATPLVVNNTMAQVAKSYDESIEVADSNSVEFLYWAFPMRPGLDSFGFVNRGSGLVGKGFKKTVNVNALGAFDRIPGLKQATAGISGLAGGIGKAAGWTSQDVTADEKDFNFSVMENYVLGSLTRHDAWWIWLNRGWRTCLPTIVCLPPLYPSQIAVDKYGQTALYMGAKPAGGNSPFSKPKDSQSQMRLGNGSNGVAGRNVNRSGATDTDSGVRGSTNGATAAGTGSTNSRGISNTDSRNNSGRNNAGSDNRGSNNTGSGNDGNDNTGSNNLGSGNQGDLNVGHGNTGSNNIGNNNRGSNNNGDRNDGFRNLGDNNQGINNQGNNNVGELNKGSGNNGSYNHGNNNKGDGNTGDRNDGIDNAGFRNTGSNNKGDLNAGNGNQGDKNTGDRNKGSNNRGNDNTGDKNSGSNNNGYNNRGNDNRGNANKGDGNVGNCNRGDCNIGNNNIGSYNNGSGNHGDGNVGDNNKGEGNLGSNNVGNNNFGSDNIGDSNVGDGNRGNTNIDNKNEGNNNVGDNNVGDGNPGNDNAGIRHQGNDNEDTDILLVALETMSDWLPHFVASAHAQDSTLPDESQALELPDITEVPVDLLSPHDALDFSDVGDRRLIAPSDANNLSELPDPQERSDPDVAKKARGSGSYESRQKGKFNASKAVVGEGAQKTVDQVKKGLISAGGKAVEMGGYAKKIAMPKNGDLIYGANWVAGDVLSNGMFANFINIAVAFAGAPFTGGDSITNLRYSLKALAQGEASAKEFFKPYQGVPTYMMLTEAPFTNLHPDMKIEVSLERSMDELNLKSAFGTGEQDIADIKADATASVFYYRQPNDDQNEYFHKVSVGSVNVLTRYIAQTPASQRLENWYGSTPYFTAFLEATGAVGEELNHSEFDNVFNPFWEVRLIDGSPPDES